ncbi:dol-P-Man:Man(7)GlcNAc(2)-PP-Dol alpha-1,6-mannosyltransferase [Caerostris extrusa]|uniref:Mannosyltransferase n=1 Tax=Caerostris extrusa TaxID=172846 RepID=A0AAV4XE52_CAEEX|nr:dol-P-Man:Man(7)GlcNAc(2)-PP-Dol alpha-1,6-mannosyltransferase [Caerostris extrusa]
MVFLPGLWVLGLTVAVDSFYWMRPTSPWAWYFYSALPRALCSSIVFIPFAFKLDYRVRTLIYPALGFIVLYSFLPHKELRFIIYTIPLLNVAAARTCAHLWNNRFKSIIWGILFQIAVLQLLVNVCATVIILSISSHNYPGGVAMIKLHEIESEAKDLNIHIDVYSAQTGVSRFTELHSNWKYNKSEKLSLQSLEIMQFTHLLMEWTEDISNSESLYIHTHSVKNITNGYSHWGLDFSSFPPIHVYLKPRILLLKRNISYPSLILNTTLTKSHKI